MTHCIDFWEKWKREPNFCGRGKSTAKSYDAYLLFVQEFSKEFDFDINLVYRNVPHSSIKSVIKFKKGCDARKAAENAIAETLRNKHSITGKFIDSVIGVGIKSKPIIEEPKVIVAPISESHREITNKNNVKEKIRLLTNALTPGQLNILNDVMISENLDNEYAAISKILVWAKERVNNG